jgi:hypothetical protein
MESTLLIAHALFAVIMEVNTHQIVGAHNVAISVESMLQIAAALYVGILEGGTPLTAAVRNAGILACNTDETRACKRWMYAGVRIG